MKATIRIRARTHRRGQALVLFAIAGIAVFGFVGLVLDGSRLHVTRRQMQNAADAGALAGARTMAEQGRTNDEVLAAISDYTSGTTTHNAYYVSEQQPLGAVADYSPTALPPASAAGVRVVAERDVVALFGSLLGQKLKRVGAEATAVYGVVKSVTLGGNAFPVAIEDDVVESASPGETIVIWDDTRVTDAQGNPLGGDRAWLNLDYIYSAEDPNSRTVSTSQSNAKVKGWILAGKTPPVPMLAGGVGKLNGDFIDGDPGVRSSSLHQVKLRIGARLIIPIYDALYTSEELADQGFSRPRIGWPNQNLFHIVGFAEFRVTRVRTGAVKAFEGEFLRSSFVEGGVAWGDDDPGVVRSEESPLTVSLVDAVPFYSGGDSATS